MITVHLTVSKSDLVRASIALFLRRPEVWKGCAVWTVLFGGFIVYLHGVPHTPRDWLALTVGATIGSLVATVLTSAFALGRMLLRITPTDGVLGEHEYSVREDGLFERTDSNETLSKWASVKGITQTTQFVLIELPQGAYHVIPKRAFATKDELNRFWSALSDYAKKTA